MDLAQTGLPENKFYVLDESDNNKIKEIHGDANNYHFEEWQIWLHTVGAPKGDPMDRCCLISSLTLEGAKEELENAQKLEKQHAIVTDTFFPNPDCTYFNPFGPIGVKKRHKSTKNSGFVHFDNILAGNKQTREYLKGLENFLPKLFPKVSDKNFSKVFEEYNKTLIQARSSVDEALKKKTFDSSLLLNVNKLEKITSDASDDLRNNADRIIFSMVEKLSDEASLTSSTLNLQSQQIKSVNYEKVIHKGVRCNGCSTTPILGNRYKCSECEDFDYCEKCKQSEAHPHVFYKVTHDLNKNYWKVFNRDGFPAWTGDGGNHYCGRSGLYTCGNCDGFCGPANGCNCPACRELDVEKGISPYQHVDKRDVEMLIHILKELRSNN